MKKLLTVVILTLALNFLALAVGVAVLFQNGTLTREKIAAIKAVLGPATTQAAVADKKDEPDATTQPTLRLEELLAKVSGRPAGEQVEFLQRTFDAQMAQLERRQRELEDLRMKADIAKREASTLLAQVDARTKKLDAREKALKTAVEDKGFEDSLTLYNSMPTKQVKDVFMSLDDATMTKYLRAMDAGRAAKILKEFKTSSETERVQRVMEMIRLQQADAIKG
jgi:vacuolar-type H+-ATPase subunit E/Vma4